LLSPSSLPKVFEEVRKIKPVKRGEVGRRQIPVPSSLPDLYLQVCP